MSYMNRSFAPAGAAGASRHPDFDLLARRFGIVMPDTVGYMPEHLAMDAGLAADAQPQLVTVSNAGIPAYLTAYIDPRVIQVLTTPNKAAEILGEAQRGDWTTRTASFPMVESTGETSSYGDWNNNGSVNANVQFPQRQSYHYQTITQWGERQLDEAGNAKIDWAQRLNIASVQVLDKFQNNSYFFGIAGLQNYGLLNDPSLSPPIQPATKSSGGKRWVGAKPEEVYADIAGQLFAELVAQTGGLVDLNSRLVLSLSPTAAVGLTNANNFNVNVSALLKQNFPGLRVVTAPQYSTAAGEMVQLIAEEIDGQETGFCGYTEKLRTHPIIQDLTAFKQKKSQGTWGAVIFLPVAVATMIGI